MKVKMMIAYEDTFWKGSQKYKVQSLPLRKKILDDYQIDLWNPHISYQQRFNRLVLQPSSSFFS